jgi:serine/threonine protein kinase
VRHDAARASTGRENPVRRESRRRAQRATTGDGPAVGDLLKNRFLLDATLGSGGMGVVFKAVDLRRLEAGHAAPYVAVKVLGRDFARDHRALQTLEAEARKAQRLAHPNVIHIHDFDRDGGHAFVVMELLEGRDLAAIVAEEGPLPFDRARRIFGPVFAALAHAHASGIIHCDVKPGNVFVGADGTVKLLDLGIASAKGLSGFDVSELGSFTAGYASPDVLKGRPQTERDDIYALGCTLYEALAGRHPFSGRHALDAIALGLAPTRVPGVPGSAWKAIARALAFERDGRFGSVEAFRSAFERRGPLARLFARGKSAGP